MPRRSPAWLPAIAVSLAVHVGATFWLSPPDVPERPILPGAGSVVLRLADSGGATGGAQPERETVPEPEPEPEPEPVPVPEPDPVPGPETVSEPTPTPTPTPTPKPTPKPKSKPKPEPEPEPEPTIETAAGGTPGAAASVASDSSSDEGGDPVAVTSYQQELLAWMQRYKRYPRRLRRRGIEGEVVVAFSLDADGRLLEYEIVRGSGEPALDEAALELLRAADPMPPIPDSIARDRYRVQVPIRYAVN